MTQEIKNNYWHQLHVLENTMTATDSSRREKQHMALALYSKLAGHVYQLTAPPVSAVDSFLNYLDNLLAEIRRLVLLVCGPEDI